MYTVLVITCGVAVLGVLALSGFLVWRVTRLAHVQAVALAEIPVRQALVVGEQRSDGTVHLVSAFAGQPTGKSGPPPTPTIERPPANRPMVTPDLVESDEIPISDFS